MCKETMRAEILWIEMKFCYLAKNDLCKVAIKTLKSAVAFCLFHHISFVCEDYAFFFSLARFKIIKQARNGHLHHTWV